MTNKSGKRIKYSILLYIACILAIFTAYSTYNNIKTINATEEALKSSVNETLIQIQSNVESTFNQYKYIANALTENPDIIRFMNGKLDGNAVDLYILQGSIFQTSLQNEYIDSIYIYNESTKNVLGTNVCTSLSNFPDKGWVESYTEQKQYFSVFQRRDEIDADKPIITVIRKFKVLGASDFYGAVIINIRHSIFSNIFKKTSAKDFMNIYITDKDNNVLYNNNDKGYLAVNVVYNPSGLNADTIDNTVITLDSHKYMLYYDLTGSNDLKYFIQTPLRRSNGFKYSSLLGLFAILFITFLITLYYINKLDKTNLNPLDTFFDLVVQHMKDNNQKFALDDNAASGSLNSIYEMLVSNDKHMKEQLYKSYPALRWRIILGILTGEYKSYDELTSYLKLLDIKFYPNNYIVIVTEIDQRLNMLIELPENMINEYVSTIQERIGKIALTENSLSLSIKTNDCKVVTIFSFETGDIDKNINAVSSFAHILQSEITAMYDITVSCGIGGFYSDIKNVNNSYLEAEHALSNKFLLGNNAVISIEDIEFTKSEDIEDILNMIEKLKTQSIHSASGAVDKIFEKIIERQVDQYIFKQFAVQIIINLFSALNSPSIKESVFEISEFKNIYYRISQFENVHETQSYIKHLINVIIEKTDEHSEALKNSKLVSDVLEYMKAHYMDKDFSLSLVSDKMEASPAHISRLFKKITGVNFIDYLTELRMKTAVSLLKESDEKISDIALRVGYINPTSFMRVFKKYTGMTPSECRNGKQ